MTFDYKYIFEKFLFLWNFVTCKYSYDYATHRSDRLGKEPDLEADHSRPGL